MMNYRMVNRFFGLALTGLLLASETGCGHSIDVTAAVEGGKVVFHVPHSRINGLLSFRVEDEAGDLLWHAKLDYEKRDRIIYGPVLVKDHNEAYMWAKQEWPGAFQPPPDIRGKVVRVIIDYQYDTLTPNAGQYVTTVKVP